ncbi:hypothetical protein F5Y04DRAFT_203355 [Hypomontagnella monticulosa]|nr:hypothetical protein F5Y04DRAFT_203355 [Hypomontagnella monticulosa]
MGTYGSIHLLRSWHPYILDPLLSLCKCSDFFFLVVVVPVAFRISHIASVARYSKVMDGEKRDLGMYVSGPGLLIFWGAPSSKNTKNTEVKADGQVENTKPNPKSKSSRRLHLLRPPLLLQKGERALRTLRDSPWRQFDRLYGKDASLAK